MTTFPLAAEKVTTLIALSEVVSARLPWSPTLHRLMTTGRVEECRRDDQAAVRITDEGLVALRSALR